MIINMQREQLLELQKDMSLSEKIGQMLQLPNYFFTDEAVLTGPALEFGIGEKEVYEAGSVLSVFDPGQIRRIQKAYMEKQPHHIPLLFMGDIINGFKTIFPIPLAQGCTFDPELARECAKAAAKESAYSGLHVTFSPMTDLVRDPRWGRVMESTGEDPYLNSCFAEAVVQGYQGQELSGEGSIAACVKHFAAYGAPEGAREYNNVELSERTLREDYLPAYEAAIKAGCALVMTSFNTLNRIPSSGNEWLMRGVLRREMGFKGVLISDWAAIEEMTAHGIAEDKKAAAELAVKAGVDIDMATNCYIKNLESLVREGKIKESMIDECVYRILELKNALGLFENPYKDLNEDKASHTILCKEHRSLARKAAAESMVLLKNAKTDGRRILPLSPKNSIAFIGPFVEEKHLYGAWSLLGEECDTVSIRMAAEERSLDAVFAKGCFLQKKGENLYGLGSGLVENVQSESVRKTLEEEAVKAAEKAERVVIALGEHAYASGEGGSHADIGLPKHQLRLLKKISRVNPNVVAVIFSGRPVLLKEVKKYAKAILMAWFPGTEGGNAVLDLLYGDVAPSGKLAMSIPRAVGQIPVYYNQFRTGRPFNGDRTNRFQSMYADLPNEPLYAFGYGLSYGKFQYSKINISSDTLDRDKEVTVSVSVKNTGMHKGTETVQLYLQDVSASVARPVKQLKGFCRVTLAPEEQREVSFKITEEMLRFYTMDMEYASEPGLFTAYIGGDSNAEECVSFTLKI